MKKIIIATLLLLPFLARAQNWTHMGPISSNMQGTDVFETGRLDQVVPDPNYGTGSPTIERIYAGSAAGGLWTTADGGGSWSLIHPDYANDRPHWGGVSAIAVTPGSAGAEGEPIYVADISAVDVAKAYSTGVYKYYPSTNTWSATGSFGTLTPPYFYVNNIQLHPSNSQIVFACTNQGLFRSSNGGTSWTLIQSGDFFNVAFLPRTSSGSYPYYVYATATNSFYESADDGVTFSHLASMESLFTGYTLVYGNLAYTASASNPGTHYIYLYAYGQTGTGANYRLYRLTYNGTTTTCAALASYVEVFNGMSMDRIAVAANDQVVYFGGVRMRQYNCLTSTMTTLSTWNSSVASYDPHDDQHCFYFHQGTKQLMIAGDGGYFVNNYTPGNNPDNGVGTNSIVRKNGDLNISQVNGFYSSEADPDHYLTGEQDTKGFFTSTNSTTFASWYSETAGGLFDKFDASRAFVRHSSYNGYVGTLTDYPNYTGYIGSSYDVFQTQGRVPSQTDFCTTSNYGAMGSPDFSKNTFYQDPSRPDRIYFGASTVLTELCPSNGEFVWKLRPHVIFPSDASPIQGIYAITASGANHNRMYFTTTARNYGPGDEYLAGVYQFTGSDIDDSWVDHNETSWQIITPDFTNTSIVPNALTFQQSCQIGITGIAASDWDENRIWISVRDVPAITGNPAVKVLQYNNGTWTNFSNGIPADEYVMSLTYERGTNDYLYLGTNRAVYVCKANETTPTWQVFNTGSPHLPYVQIRQLQVNYTTNTIWAGTYGHGVWQSELECPAQSTLTKTGTISSSEFDEAAQWVAGQNCTISNGNVKFRAGDYVELQPDFLVTANSSTEFLAFIHNCSGPGNTFRKQSTVASQAEEKPRAPASPGRGDMLSVYPNPSEGRFFLHVNSENILVSVEIYDLMGKLVYSNAELNERDTEVDLSGKPKGLYLLKARCGEDVQTVKIINR